MSSAWDEAAASLTLKRERWSSAPCSGGLGLWCEWSWPVVVCIAVAGDSEWSVVPRRAAATYRHGSRQGIAKPGGGALGTARTLGGKQGVLLFFLLLF